jgi:hypothetical protein
MKKIIIICLFLVSNLLSASDWRLIHYIQFENFESIDCRDGLDCYAFATYSKSTKESGFRIYKSIDNSRTWELLYQGANTYGQERPKVITIEAGESPHPAYYFVLSYTNTVLMKSIDSARTFKKIILDADNYYPDQFAMYDTSIGFLTNSNSVYITKDGWETFERHPFLGQINVYSPQFIDSNTLVMTLVSDQNPYGFVFVKYHFNENKFDSLSYFGFNSGSDQSANDFQRIYNIYFLNDLLGFGCGSARVHQGQKEYFDMIYKTTDGGYTWKTVFRELNYPEVGLNNNIAFADEKNGIAVGRYGKIAMTNDGGETWVYEPYPNDMKNCRKMQVCWAGRTPIIGTWDKGIFRYEGDFFKFPPDTAKIQADNQDFGTKEIHDTTTTIQKIKIHNQSYADLLIFGFSELTETAFTNEFVWLDTITYITVKPNEYFELPVSFKPTEVRKYKDSIIVYSNATKQDSVIVLEGEGIDSTIGVKDNLITNYQLLITPNPVENDLKTFLRGGNSSSKMQFIIHNSQGVEIYNSILNYNQIQNEMIINTSNFSNGLYQISFYINNLFVESKSFIVYR